MGLPSGVQWANCNVGAESPSDLGLYFSWGNIEGHSVDEEYNFSLSVYRSTPAAAIDTDLSLSQDAARANLGELWRMPTAAEFQELMDNCTSMFETIHGVNGILFISNVNGNTLFFPAAGQFQGTAIDGRNSRGYYWSSTFTSGTDAKALVFASSIIDPLRDRGRHNGFSVRAVLQPT